MRYCHFSLIVVAQEVEEQSLESATAWSFGGLMTRLKVAINDLALLVYWQA